MATDNPKISGYVPQEIFDCLLEFKEKRSLKSVSLALTVALSEYFGVDQKVDRQSSLLLTDNFVSKDRFEALENKVSELNSSLLSELDKLVEQRFSSLRSELLNSLPKHIEAEAISVESSLVSEPLDELLSKPLKNEPLIEAKAIFVENELPSELSDESPHLSFINSVLEKEDLKEEKSIPKSISEQSDFAFSKAYISLSGQRLAKRLSITTSTLSSRKMELSEQDFYNWLQEKDPDKISWRSSSGDLKKRVSGWIPAKDTSSELLSRLKEWVDSNPLLS